LIKGFIEDIKFLWRFISDESFRNRTAVHTRIIADYIRKNFTSLIKEFWWVWMLMLGAACVGYFLSASIYTNKCNAILIERGCDMIKIYTGV